MFLRNSLTSFHVEWFQRAYLNCWHQKMILSIFFELAKQRAMRVSVLTLFTCQRACVPAWFTCQRAKSVPNSNF